MSYRIQKPGHCLSGLSGAEYFQGEGISQSEQVLTDREKNEQWLELTVSPLTDTKGETRAAIIVQRDVTARKRKDMEKELLIRQLLRSMTEVRKPNGIVTICMFCKKTHDESDKKWTTIETLLQHRLNIQLSHGLCSDCCGQKHYPEFTT
ncbi:MAG: PAS domain-containing protein [Desulfobulbaceae bacterium]